MTRIRILVTIGLLVFGATLTGAGATLAGAFAVPGDDPHAAFRRDDQEPAPTLSGRVVAVGIPAAAGVAPVGRFLPGGPIHDKPEFAAFTAAGQILDSARILVTSSSNFGAPPADPTLAPGAVLSINPAGAEPLVVPADFGAAGGQASTLGGRVQLFTAQSPAFINGVNNPNTMTAALPSVSNPRAISINNAFGRIWPANVPSGLTAPGTSTILDPTGIPLAGPPNKLAGGVFTGDLTNRLPEQTRAGGIMTGAVGTAFLGKSTDDSGRAVFAVLTADGGIIQVHTEQAVDGLAPAGTISPLWDARLERDAGFARDPRAGMVLNFEPLRILYVADPAANAVVALTLEDDRRVFLPGSIRRIESPLFDLPVDLAPAKPETEDTDWASNTTAAEDADLYVLNRGNSTVVRIHQDGAVVAVRRVALAGGTALGDACLNGIAVSPDGTTIWVTVTGELPGFAGMEGAVIALPAFGAE